MSTKGDGPNQGVVGDVPSCGNAELELRLEKPSQNGIRGDCGVSWVIPSRKSPECSADRGLCMSAGDPSSSISCISSGYFGTWPVVL